MTKISIEEDLLNRLLAKCSAEIERHAGSADSANITFEKNRCVKTLFPKSSCTQCVQVCREQALSIKDQTIAIENSECSASAPASEPVRRKRSHTADFRYLAYWPRLKIGFMERQRLLPLLLPVQKPKAEKMVYLSGASTASVPPCFCSPIYCSIPKSSCTVPTASAA